MPRCCAGINDSTGTTVVYVQVDVPEADKAKGQAAVAAAATAAYTAAGFSGTPVVESETDSKKITP